jgi:predicted acyltransferase
MEPTPQRFLALDVFRGMTVCFMIIVNTPGNESFVFSPLNHAKWSGFTPTDLVFPSFLFAVGNAMSFVMKKYQASGYGGALKKIFRRAFLIFLLGYLMYWFPFFHHSESGGWALNPIGQTRIFGVLQRIALCYFFGSLLILYFPKKTVLILSIIILFGYWFLLLSFGAAGTDPFGMLTNAGTLLDKWVMGDNHLYHGEGVAFDPEGILSTLPAIVNVVIGYYTGLYIQQKGKTFEGLTKLMLTGTVLILAALSWDMVFPINKKLWTSSFVLYTTGIDIIFISILVYLIDFKQLRRGTGFFTVFGKNPLPIYLLSELMATILFTITIASKSSLYEWLNNNIFQAISPGKLGSLLFAVCYMLFCWSVGKLMDKNKIYIRV